jgi:hypothetical protein
LHCAREVDRGNAEGFAMKYLIVSVIAILATALRIYFVGFVLGAKGKDGSFTDEFWLKGFFMVLGFLVTTATISPLAALFLDWRSNRAWSAARLPSWQLCSSWRKALCGP